MKAALRIPNTLLEVKPWLKSFGKLRGLHKETMRIDRLIEAEFSRIEPEPAAPRTSVSAVRKTIRQEFLAADKRPMLNLDGRAAVS